MQYYEACYNAAEALPCAFAKTLKSCLRHVNAALLEAVQCQAQGTLAVRLLGASA